MKKSKSISYIWNNPDDVLSFKGLFILFIITLVFNALYVYFTRFEKIITIDEKNTYGSRKTDNQRISDTDGNIYVVKDSLMMMHWTSIELFNKLDSGKTFKVSGYGMRVPFFGMIPNITSAVEIK